MRTAGSIFVCPFECCRLQELPQEAVADPQLAVKELVLLEPAVRMGITFRTEDSGRPKKVSQLGMQMCCV